MRTRCRKCGAGHGGNEGMVLFFVIALCLGLTAIILLFASSMRLEYRASGNALAGAQAEQALEGARRYVSYVLTNQEEPGRLPELDEYKQELLQVGDANIWLLGREPSDPTPQSPTYGLVDEAGKVNINTAPQEVLEALPQMTPELAAAIVDWRDADSDLSEGGAESGQYLMLDTPYQCKNSNFESVAELRLVYGMTMDVLAGEDWNRNSILDPSEDDGDVSQPRDNQDGRLETGLFEHVTIYRAEPATNAAGEQKVNPLTAEPDELQQVVQTAGGDRVEILLAALQQARQAQPGSLLEFYMQSGLSEQDFSLIEDSITFTNEATPAGAINVNTASEAVLSAIPGIGSKNAAGVISARSGKDAETLASVAWVAEVLEQADAALAGPHITTRSYQYSADVIAVGKYGRGFRRVQFVFDTQSGEPRLVARLDLQRSGWPLGQAVRQRLLEEQQHAFN